jgi:CHAT domain-containing protein/tetratricopeptide (TPR) repeat protein
MSLKRLILAVLLVPIVSPWSATGSSVSSSAEDPVAAFIAHVDSIADTSDQNVFSRYVEDNPLIVGAAVGELLDEAIQTGDGGGTAEEEKKFALAHRIAAIHKESARSPAPLDLVSTYSAWDSSTRAERRRAKAIEKEGTEAQQAGDFAKAIERFTRAREMFNSIGDRRSVAVLWGSLGVAYWYTGDYEAVKRQYEEALKARRAIDDRILEGKTLNGLGSVHYQLGDYASAFDFYTQAVELRRKTGDLDGLGTSLTYLGNTYLALGRTIDARNTYEQALPLVERAGQTEKLYEILTSVASLHAECGRLASSNDALRRALALARSLNDPIKQLICHNNLALNLADAYQYHDALEEIDAAKRLLEETPDPEQSIVFHCNRGVTLLRLGELAEARDDFITLLRLSREHKMPHFELQALINLGYLLTELGALDEGLRYAQEARALSENLGNQKMTRESLMLSADITRLLGQYDAALGEWEELLDRDRAAKNEIDVLKDRLGLANLLVISGREADGRRMFHEMSHAVDASTQGDLELVVALGLGHSFEATNPDSAYFYYEQALGILENARSRIDDPERTGFLGGSRRFYVEEVARYYARRAMAGADAIWGVRAFQTIEKAKARGLFDLMAKSLSARHSPTEEGLLDSLYIASRIDTKKKRAYEIRYEREQADRVGSIMARYGTEQPVVDPATLGRMLPKHAAFLSYALGDTFSLLWVIDRDGFDIFELPDRKSLRASVSKLRDAIARPGLGDEALRQSAHELYTFLIAPAEKRLKNARELIIAPDGVLFELPFEALLTKPAPEKATWGGMPYLARAFAITYVPSASVFLAMHAAPGNAKYDKDLLAFGDPDYSLLNGASEARTPWRELPQTRSEVQAIGSSLPAAKRTVFLGADATEARLKSLLNEESYRVLHLATHGVVDKADPAASMIVLCPDADGRDDGYLHTTELLSMHLRIDCAVLSACESARGQIGRGEGVVGLSRALLASGVHGVVASLWAVSDESTARLMKEFYARMLGSKEPAYRALNEARCALMGDERFAHPYYWSPFIVIGSERLPW